MDHGVLAPVMLTEFVNLRVAVVAAGDAVIRAGFLDLLILELAVLQAFLLESGLEETAAAAATVVVGLVGLHVDEVFFTHDGLDHESEIIGNGIAEAFPDDLTGILNRELDLPVLVPVGVDLQLAFADPLCVVLINVLYFKVVLEVELFQSGPD